jgi:hypothetical protein
MKIPTYQTFPGEAIENFKEFYHDLENKGKGIYVYVASGIIRVEIVVKTDANTLTYDRMDARVTFNVRSERVRAKLSKNEKIDGVFEILGEHSVSD